MKPSAPDRGYVSGRRVPGERAACLWTNGTAASDAPVPEHPRSADRAATAHEAAGADADSVPVPEDPGAADP